MTNQLLYSSEWSFSRDRFLEPISWLMFPVNCQIYGIIVALGLYISSYHSYCHIHGLPMPTSRDSLVERCCDLAAC